MKWILSLVCFMQNEARRLSNSPAFKVELANGVSHAVGMILGGFAGIWLLVLAFETQLVGCIVSTLIYVMTLILLYGASTIYHLFHSHPRRELLRKIDHISIYFLIAGTYTPFLVCYLDDLTGKIYLALLWGLVLFGIFFKIKLIDRFKWLSLALYLLMGWIIVFNLPAFWDALPFYSLVWILIGGFFYTTGVIFYIWYTLNFNHFIWHLFVLGGSISHYLAVYYCISELK